jgi:hypothetical protein
MVNSLSNQSRAEHPQLETSGHRRCFTQPPKAIHRAPVEHLIGVAPERSRHARRRRSGASVSPTIFPRPAR